MACVPGVTLTVLAGFDNEDKFTACLALLIVIVLCISLHGCLKVSFFCLDSLLGVA